MTLFRSCSLLAVTLTVIAGCADDSSDAPAGGGAGAGGQTSGGAAGSSAGRSPQAGAGGAGTAGKGGGSAGAAAGSGGAVAGGGGASAGSGGVEQGGAAGEGGADPGQGLIEACLDAEVIDGTRTEAITLKGDGVEVGLVRRVDPDGFSTSGTTVWLSQHFGIVRGALAKCVTAPADLTYTISHHNFDDEMTADVEGQTLLVTMTRADYSDPLAWTITSKQGDTVSWGPLTLTLTGCTRLDSGASCLPEQ